MAAKKSAAAKKVAKVKVRILSARCGAVGSVVEVMPERADRWINAGLAEDPALKKDRLTAEAAQSSAAREAALAGYREEGEKLLKAAQDEAARTLEDAEARAKKIVEAAEKAEADGVERTKAIVKAAEDEAARIVEAAKKPTPDGKGRGAAKPKGK